MTASSPSLTSPSLTSPLQARAPRPKVRASTIGAGRNDGLTPAQRRVAVGLIVAAHAGGIWALMQVGEVREAAREVMPMFVDLIAPSAPPTPAPPLPAPPPPQVAPKPRPVVQRAAPPVPAPAIIAAPPSPAPASFTTPAVTSEAPSPPAPASLVVASAPASLVVASAPAPAAAPAAAPARVIPPSEVQYLIQPAPEYPRASNRNRESGRVLVLVFIDPAGLPSQVQVARSSGFTRLDDAAVAAVAKARFRPPSLNGEPVSGWTNVTIDFELEIRK